MFGPRVVSTESNKLSSNTTSSKSEASSHSKNVKCVVIVRLRVCNLKDLREYCSDKTKTVAGKRNEMMISILTQERLLGASLGVVLTGVVVLEQRRYIYSSISNSQSHSQVREPIFGKKSRSEFAHLWNKTVDQTFEPLIKSLSSRGW